MGRRARGHTPSEHDGEIPPPPRSQQTPPSDREDDRRSRVIQAVYDAVYLSGTDAEVAVDAALASGHVRLTDPGEPDISVEAYWAVSEERDKAEARAECAEAANERLRGALRQIRDNPFADQWAQFLARVTLSADAEPSP